MEEANLNIGMEPTVGKQTNIFTFYYLSQAHIRHHKVATKLCP
jgi:hypothetical protein